MSDDSSATPGVSGWCSPQITGLTGTQGVDCPQCERVGGAGHQVHHQEWAGLAVLGEDLLPGGRHRHHDLQAGVVPRLHRVGVRAEDLNKEQLNWPEWTAVNQTSHCSQWVQVKQFIFATDTMRVSHWLTAGPGWSRQNIFKDWSEVKREPGTASEWCPPPYKTRAAEAGTGTGSGRRRAAPGKIFQLDNWEK